MNAHEVLGVRRGASPEDVRAAWRRRVLATHPDRGGDESAFQEALEAYRRLTGSAGGEPSAHRGAPVVFVRRSGMAARASRWWRRRRHGRRAPRVV